MLNLNDLRIFVEAVDNAGFAAAGRHLGIPKSTVSKRVAELEAGLGVRLIHRTSRSFRLTDLGHDVYEHARAALIEAESAENVVRRHLAEPSGIVRLTAALPTMQFTLAAHLPELALLQPRVRLQVHATDRFVDLVQEGFDIAVRSHFEPLPDSSLVQRRLATESVILVASPGYLTERGVPESPEDLAVHDGLLTGPAATVWRLHGAGGEARAVSPAARMVADESMVLMRAAAAGLGVVCLPASICRAAVDSGELARVLPGWSSGTVTTTLLMPHRRGQLPAVRAVADFLVSRLGHQG